jgi:uncharacterized membrane protein
MPRANDDRSLSERITQTFITGVMGILPLAISLAVVAWVVVFLHDLVGPNSAFGRVLRNVGMTVVTCEVVAYAAGLVGTVLLVYGLGLLVENGGGGYWQRAMDGALHRIPLLGTVYDASKNVTSVFDRRSDSLQGMAPVICYFGNDRGAATLALMPTPDLVRVNGQEYHVVIVPTAPVPFGGALLCVKADFVEPAGCGLDDLVGIFMSMGVSAPRCLGGDSREQTDGDSKPPNA